MSNVEGFVTPDQLVNFAAKADKRLDALESNAVKSQDLTLTASEWTQDSGDTNYPYKYELTVEGVTDASRADAVLDTGSVAIASDCGVCAVSETATNTVIFRSRTAPTADLIGVLYIRKAAVLSGN